MRRGPTGLFDVPFDVVVVDSHGKKFMRAFKRTSIYIYIYRGGWVEKGRESDGSRVCLRSGERAELLLLRAGILRR